ncbi:LacI family DNA-binding transcriptional regulator [Streptomyces sp. NPDC102274]|uniref:LacI family DNA-binding transcriptional regulator n=1 Tax=Streptomyces sp. NPDC102274 TaxID=3366151 RepID=UPI0038181073
MSDKSRLAIYQTRPGTVSYVFNGSRTISEKTRRRVREAVDALGYHPRASARTLRSSRTQVPALALPRAAGLPDSVDGRFAIDVSDAANALGYDLLLTMSQDKAGGLRRVALSGLADAAAGVLREATGRGNEAGGRLLAASVGQLLIRPVLLPGTDSLGSPTR